MSFIQEIIFFIYGKNFKIMYTMKLKIEEITKNLKSKLKEEKVNYIKVKFL